MSRIGKNPVPVPDGVTVSMDGETFVVSGPKGELRRDVPVGVSITIGDGQVVVERGDDSRRNRSLHGLIRSLVQNMITGVTDGYSKSLELIGVGYRAEQRGRALQLQVGFSHPVDVEPPEGIELEAPQPNRIVVSGIDKVLVGQVAANIRSIREPEPYKGKGIRYVDERVRRKAGKAAAR